MVARLYCSGKFFKVDLMTCIASQQLNLSELILFASLTSSSSLSFSLLVLGVFH